jgi:hypothetical protein
MQSADRETMAKFHVVFTGTAEFDRSDMVHLARECGGMYHVDIPTARRRANRDNLPVFLVVGKLKLGVYSTRRTQEAELDGDVEIIPHKDFMQRQDMLTAAKSLMSKVPSPRTTKPTPCAYHLTVPNAPARFRWTRTSTRTIK